jgi:uncharacterized protein (TIGR02996 family)
VTDRDRLLRAILDNPEEDTPRLMFADEVEADQPHRAEFIRVGCELARTPETVKVVGPDRRINRTSVEKGGEWWEVNPEYKRLCDRRNELLARHAYHWLPEVPGLRRYAVGRNFGPDYVAVGYHTDAPLADGDRIIPLPPPIRVEFRRGFVERVTCSGDDWARHGDRLLAAHPVRRVTFTDAGPEVRYWLADFRIQRCRHEVGGVVVEVPERDAALARDDREVTRQILTARWPRIPPDGWAFAPPQERVHGTVIDENGNWVVVSRTEDGRLATDVFSDPYSGT